MKTNILILVIFITSLTINCTSYSQDLIVDNSFLTVSIHHNAGKINGSPCFIVFEIPREALQYHLNHGDYLNHPTPCEPPLCRSLYLIQNRN